MALRSDDLLDQLDSRLSKMQAQLPSNPDPRPLPCGWVEHLDPHRKAWYYIDLGAAQPRATFSHPVDELIDEGEELANNPPTLSTFVHASSSRPPSRTRVKSPSTPIGSTAVCRRTTTAQQLYASSLASGSRSVRASRESVSSSNTSSNSDPEHSNVVSTPSFPQNHLGRGDPSSRASPIGPAFPVYPNSHDPRNFFDITRLCQGARKYRHDEASRSNGSSQTVLPRPPSPPQSPSPSHPSARADVQTNNNLASTMNTLSLSNDPSSTPATSGLIPSEAQALYNPSVIAKPLSPSRATIVADRRNYSISVPLSGGVSRTERDQKRPQPIQITHRPSADDYKLYTAVTEDETLKVVPNSGSTGYPDASGITEDNLLVLPSHPTPQRDTHLSPTINVLDVQNPDTPPPVLHESKTKSPVRTLSMSRLHIRKKKKSPSVDGTLVLQQPRPVRPLGGLSAQLNDQVSGLDSSEDAQYYAESFKGKGKERKSYGFSSIFETMDRLANRESGIIIKEYA